MRKISWILVLAAVTAAVSPEEALAQRRDAIAVAFAEPRHFSMVMSTLNNLDDYLRAAQRMDFEGRRIVLLDIREAVPEEQGRLRAYRERLRQRSADVLRVRRLVNDRPALRNALRYADVSSDEVVAIRIDDERQVIVLYDRGL